jgi:hypothetical protein
MQRDKLKTAVAIITSLYFFSIVYNPFNPSFLDFIDLPIHETGHLVFRLFGQFLGIAGGSIFQVVFPAVFVGYFIYNEKPFSAAIVLFWVGQSVLNVFIYANDAVVMQLMLTSGMTGSEGGFHDWNYLLTETGLIGKTNLVAGFIRFLGSAVIIVSSTLSIKFALKSETQEI